VRRGFAAFPLAARSKRPVPGEKWESYRDNPLTAEQAAELDATDRNVAIITGAASGIFVLDLDGPEAERVAAEKGWIADTLTVATGKGRHLYYQMPDFEVRNSAGKLAEHVDIRGSGGYVVAPGSVHPDGHRYELIDGADAPAVPPAALVDALRPPARGRRSGGNRGGNRSRGAGEVEALLGELRAAREGTRNAEANRIAFRIGQLVAAGRIEVGEAEDRLREVCEEIGLEPAEIDHILPRVIEEGMSSPRNSDGDEPISQVVMARVWCDRHGHGRRHDHTRGQWMIADRASGIWRADESRAVFHEIGAAVHELGGGAARYSCASFIKGTETLAAALPGVAVTHDAFNGDPLMLGTPDGPVDLRTGKLLPPDPSLLISKNTSVAPRAGDAPKWREFLNQSTGGDALMVEFLQRVWGYMLTGLTIEQALFFIYGDGGNGKGVFINVGRRIMGDYAVTSAMETFTVSRNERHSTELAMLRGARAVLASETEKGKKWAESRIKQLTGNDEITARFMRQDNFTFTPEFKLFIIGNFHPALDTVDDAMRRRFNIIPFTRKPPVVNPRLEEELEAEFPQILRWMIDGCLKWQRDGLKRPQAVVEATNDYFEEQDLFGQWLEDFCVVDPGHQAATNDLYHNWSLFAEEVKEDAGSIKSFGSMLTKRGFVPGRETGGKRLRFWKGLKLQTVTEPGTGAQRVKTPRDAVGEAM
jgi:P4 family phage/plasmid primase-like protien